MKKSKPVAVLQHIVSRSTSFNTFVLAIFSLIAITWASSRSLNAAVSITAPTLNISTPSFPSGYFALGNIVIDEGANNDFPIASRNTDYTITITAPSNFEFLAGSGSITAAAGDITTISVSVSATVITITYRSSQINGTRNDQDDILTISGLQVRAINTASSQNATKTASSETISGLTNGTVMASFNSVLACNHTIRLTDTFGDGWNGGTITVTVNGVPVLTNITMATATAGPEDFTFPANNGDVINITRTADGTYPAEMRIEVIGGAANTILATQEPVGAPGTTISGCCTPTVPGVATYVSPANGALNQNVCGVALSWNAPANTGCNAATSYDVYLGTAASPPFLGNTTSTMYTLPFALADNTTYYWKIVPRNASGTAIGCTTWSFTTSTSPNPAYCMYDDALNYPAGGTNCAQMTPESTSQSGCIWNRSKISFASAFDYTINMYFGNNVSGGDGCAFVFQNSPVGISACGNDGSQLGAGGISNSVIIEFDTYDNDSPWHTWDIAQDHVAIEIDGDPDGPAAPFAGPVVADAVDGVLDDGALYALRVTWNPATQLLSVYVNGNLRLTANYDFINNVFGGDPNVWWGFTGSTGGLTNQQYFCPVTIPVPVELLEFSAECQSDIIEMNWFTASEQNNLYFTIEKSSDGCSFLPAATIIGAGNSNSPLAYHYKMKNQSHEPINYVRLSQTDTDGKTTLLGTRSVECDENALRLEIISFSRLSSMQKTLMFITPVDGVHEIGLYDMNGKALWSGKATCKAGLNQADICLDDIGGIVILKLSNEYDYVVLKTIF